MRATYHQGNPQMTLDWMFGQPITFNTVTDHGYTDGQISSIDVSDSLDFIHGAGCIAVGDTTLVVTYNNNPGFFGLTTPAKHTLYKVFASGDSTIAQEVWALSDHSSPEFYSTATGEARWIPNDNSPIIMFQEGLGGEMENGIPLPAMVNPDVETRHDEFVFRDITGGVVATMDWSRHNDTQLDHVSKQHLPDLDSIQVTHDENVFTLVSTSEVIWEQYGQVISEGMSLTLSDTSNLDHVHGWLSINLYSWRLPKKSTLWTGIGEEPARENITFWPNPSSGTVNLSRETDVKVFSMTGVLVIEHTGVKSFSTQQLSAGVYVLELKNKRALLVVE